MNVHNEQKFIEKSIKSALNQTFENFEFLIVDDASTDNTFEILKEFEKKDKRIKIYKNDFKKGPAESANNLIKLSVGAHTARLDGDDIWIDSKLEKQLLFLQEEKCDFVCTDAFYIDDEDKVQHLHKPPTGKFLNWSLNFLNHIRHSTVIWKGKFLYDENFFYSLDYELWTRARKNHTIKTLEEATTLYRNHPNSITNSQREEQIRLANIVSKREIEFYLNKSLTQEEVNNLQHLFRTNHECENEDFQKLKKIFLD